MASAGAHLTSTVAGQDDQGDRPSIFELLAQDGLTTALRPALKYAVRILAEKNPAKFGWLYGFGDELYSVLDLIVEHYYLKHYSKFLEKVADIKQYASFAENFYGLKRVPVCGGKLTASARLKSICYLVLLPYIKEKCDQVYERMAESHASHSKLQRAFLAVYPYLHCLHNGAMFLFQVAYVFGKSSFHSPWLRLAGLRLLCLTEDDVKEQMSPRVQDNTDRSRLYQLVLQASAGLGTVLSGALSVSVFFLHFLEWWYSSEQHSTAAAVTALPTPLPPAKSVSTAGGGTSTVSSGGSNEMCPICRRVRTNHTALAVSGYVFCYPCIYRHIQKVGRCPVTGFPASSDHLLKLYLPDS